MPSQNVEKNAESNENVTKDSPLFKFEGSKDKRDYSMLLYTGVAIAIVVILYVISILLSNYVFAALAFTFALVFAVVLFGIYRQIHKSEHVYSDEEIDNMVEKYKADLVDTFNGYDVSYTANDILEAADGYREKLEEQNTSIVDADPRDIGSILRLMIKDGKDSRERNKKAKAELREMRARDKKAKKNNR